MTRRPARTLLELCVANAGPVKGGRVAGFIACWTIASESLGRPITIDDYAEWWGEHVRTTYRHQARFREVFPQLDTPQPIADAAIERAPEWRGRGVRGLGALPADVVRGGRTSAAA